MVTRSSGQHSAFGGADETPTHDAANTRRPIPSSERIDGPARYCAYHDWSSRGAQSHAAESPS